MIYTIKNSKYTVNVSTLGAEVISIKDATGYEYMWQGDTWPEHAPVLFPICGQLNDAKYIYGGKEYAMKGHGFAPKKEFKLIKHTDESVIMELAEDIETLSSYPFRFSLTAEYKLCSDKLEASFTVENRDDTTLPYMFGWHPAFALGGDEPIEDFSLRFDNAEDVTMHLLTLGTAFMSGETIPFPLVDKEYRLNEKQIYTNDTLILTGTGGKAILKGKKDPHEVTITYSENLSYFCVWKWDTSDTRFLCLEPWSGTPNKCGDKEVFETRKMERLAPGCKETYYYTVKCN